MIYTPKTGKMKDNCMIYENGRFYMFSMYQKSLDLPENNVFLAISDDGVHFEDYGCVVEDFDDYIWAMKVYKTDDGFYMNSGSFSSPGVQDVLKFWHSDDLLNWTYMPDLDIKSPQNEKNEYRLDCMNVIKTETGYFGCATGQFGFLKSSDGAHFEFCDEKTTKAAIDYSPFVPYNEAGGGFEVADYIYLNEKYYMLCGGFGHLGMIGYGVFVYESDSPFGPFKPNFPNYRLNGTSNRWVNMWERCFVKDGEYLAHNYMYDGYSYENGAVYLPPIKKLNVGENGLYLSWWSGNDILKGEKYCAVDKMSANAKSVNVFESEPHELALSEETARLSLGSSVLEFDLTLDKNTFTEYSKGGFYFEESETGGTAILFDTYGKAEIAYIEDKKIKFIEDTIACPSAAAYYLRAAQTYHVRVLIRGGLFEIYIDEKYLQTFNTAHFKDKPLHAIRALKAASCRRNTKIENLSLYKMSI